ncbi:hypothetical protein OS493_020437 [Desmophyllum pertusum]|uniref:Major facilitator superfamily (MFS) profile domain-containing protein n=1 Tax=Desmophyllum pertusum TaxID=174260 RepID=A0A9X0CYA4_9CNID|nr:hypothetical protein OS493_020437 [Desmophyllum pertusum]
MVKNHTVVIDGVETDKEAEFNWSSKLQGVVLGSFYYGYVALQIPGGWLALKVGGTRLFGVAVLIASTLTLLTPVASRTSVVLLIIVRVGEGLVLGVLFPCNHAIWSKWAPSMERTTLVSIAVTGCTVGSIVTMPISGLLTRYDLDGGWPAVFYTFGIFGILWYVAWFVLAFESPSVHPTITEDERSYIELTAINMDEVTKGSVPWKSIITSGPVWGIIVAAFASDWGLYVLLICVPLFLMDILHYEVAAMGFAAAAPFVFKSLSCPIAGITADLLRRNILSTKTVRKVYYTTGALTAGVFILMAGYFKEPNEVIGCMCVAGAAAGMVYAGFQVNMLDIAPRNASVVMGIVNAASNTAGFLSPMLVGFITHDKTAREWRTVFWITFLLYVIGSIVFIALMTADRQKWDKVEGVSREPTTEDAITPR